jgi:hypothetical protein
VKRCLIGCSFLLCAVTGQAVEIQVFMRPDQFCSTCASYNVKPIIIGEQKIITKKINIRLASESHPDTKEIVAEYMPELKAAYKNIAQSYAVGVTKVPAVVFEHKYIIYGTTNIYNAMSLYREAKQKGKFDEKNQ